RQTASYELQAVHEVRKIRAGSAVGAKPVDLRHACGHERARKVPLGEPGVEKIAWCEPFSHGDARPSAVEHDGGVAIVGRAPRLRKYVVIRVERPRQERDGVRRPGELWHARRRAELDAPE